MRRITIHTAPNPDTLPPAFRDLGNAIRELNRVRAESGAAHAKARQLADSRAQAVYDDRMATKKAIQSGKPDPGPRIQAALDVRIAQERNRADAYAMLVEEAQAKVLDLLADNHAEYADGIATAEAEARASLAAALGPVRAALDTLSAAYTLQGYLDAAADPRTTTLRARTVGLSVFGLMKRNGDPYAASTVIDALEALTAAPEEPEEVEPHPLWPRDAGDGVYVTRS